MTALDALKTAYHRTWWALVIRGLVSCAVGILILLRPLESVAAFALAIALWSIMSGVVEMVQAFELRASFGNWWVGLVSGIVGVGFGIAALYYYPVLSLAFAVVWVSWWLLVIGAVALYAGSRLRGAHLPWGWPFAAGVVSLVAGVLAIARPPATLAALMALIATFGIVGGLALLIGAFRLKALERRLESALL